MSLYDSIQFTKLKSLKFEDYGEKPFIINDINNPKNLNKNLITASATDTLRISKFLTTGKGALFVASQVSTQLMNPQIQSGVPKSGIKFIDKFIDKLKLSNNRIYNLGINTLSQIPLTGFGAHMQRHGLLPGGTPSNLKYENTVKENDEDYINRLNDIKDKLFNDDGEFDTTKKKSKINLFQKISKITNTSNILYNIENDVIYEYIGGPNSLGGIGVTKIKRYDNTKDKFRFEKINILNKINTSTSTYIYPGLSDDNPIKNFSKNLEPNQNNFLLNPTGSNIFKQNNFIIENNTVKQLSSNNVILPISQSLKNDIFKDSNGIELNKFNILKTDVLTNISYINNNDSYIGYTNYYGDTYKATAKNKKGWIDINRENRIGSNRVDEINLTPLFKSDAPLEDEVNIGGKVIKMRDLIKFRIEAIDNDNPEESIWMVFRSYLKNISDSHTPEWNSVTYAGRGEEFYIYNKTKRQMSFSFQVAALSAKEMMPMYQKLNYLASTVYPDYTKNGLMRGNFHKFTIGNYIYRQPCIINSLNYTISDDTPWEIAMSSPENSNDDVNMYELPHIINVQLNITPIHNFLPQKSPLLPFIYEEIIRKNPWKQDIIKYNNNPESPAKIL